MLSENLFYAMVAIAVWGVKFFSNLSNQKIEASSFSGTWQKFKSLSWLARIGYLVKFLSKIAITGFVGVAFASSVLAFKVFGVDNLEEHTFIGVTFTSPQLVLAIVGGSVSNGLGMLAGFLGLSLDSAKKQREKSNSRVEEELNSNGTTNTEE